MNVTSLELKFADFELLHCYNALLKFLRGISCAETVQSRNSQNKSHGKFRTFTVCFRLTLVVSSLSTAVDRLVSGGLLGFFKVGIAEAVRSGFLAKPLANWAQLL